jgi:hypothetical protein
MSGPAVGLPSVSYAVSDENACYVNVRDGLEWMIVRPLDDYCYVLHPIKK